MSMERFQAQSETGSTHVIIKVGSRINIGGLDGPSSVEGMATYMLESGEKINKIDDRRFKVPSSGEILTRI